MAEPHSSDACPDRSPAPARIVRFRLRDRTYAISMERISGLAPIGRVRAVPGAPSGVHGLVEWRGRLLTVLDFAVLVDDGAGDGTPCLVRLAEPFGATALLVPATVHLERLRGFPDRVPTDPTLPFGSEGTLDLEDGPCTLIDPTVIVRALERAVDADGRA
jgi:hypothetical protein